MLVGERMSQPVISITKDLPIHDALALFKKEHICRAPVLQDGKLIGIISDKDLLNATPSRVTSLSVWEMNYMLSKITVKEVMTRKVFIVQADTPIEEAARLMADNKIGGVPVMKADKVVGIITETDLFKAFLELMENSIAERMKEQATLLETSTAVVSSLDLSVVLDRILEQVGGLLNVKMIAIIALDEGRGEFRIRASHGLSQGFTEQLSIQPSEPSSVSMRALRVREPIQVSDTETDPSYKMHRSRARAEGYRAVLAVPLITQHAPPTCLLVYHPTPHEFTTNEMQLLSGFANQATMAIENAILFERSDTRLQEQTRRLEALVQSMEDGLILSDLKGMVIYANRRVAELSDLTNEDIANIQVEHVMSRVLGKSIESISKEDEIRNILEGSKQKSEITLIHTGRPLHLRFETFDVTDARDMPIGRGVILHDITVDRELDRMKSNLISTVSHELRTPLAAIKGYASTLLAEDVEWDSKSQREFLTIISNETDRLTSLVNNLLDLSRIEAGSLRLTLEKCNIKETILRGARQARLESGNRFEVQLEPGLPSLYADMPRLETVIRNLIENSVKYGGEQAFIQMKVNRQDDTIVFRVMDDGPGIPPEKSEQIFERFFRLDDSFARVTSGAGLGLAICQGLVRAHKGEIWVEPIDAGACIAFAIPLNLHEAKDELQ